MRVFIMSICSAILLHSCFLATDLEDDPTVWEYVQPMEEAMNEAVLLQLSEDVNARFYGETTNFTVIKNGKLVFENYYNDSHRTSIHNVGQVSIGWISAVFGEVLSNELNGNLDIPIANFLTEYESVFNENPTKREITVRHILEMRSGLVWNEIIRLPTDTDSDVRNIQLVDDPVLYFLEKPLEASPGIRYSFKSASSLILLKVIERVIDESLEEYFQKTLFSPLGVTPQFTTLNDGTPNFVWGLSMDLIDFSKVNYLMFKRGDWFGQQVLDSEWLTEIMEEQLAVSLSTSLGYHWKRFGPSSFVSEVYGLEDVVYQFGDMSQAVYFSESEDLLVSVNAQNPTTSFVNFSYGIFLRVLESDRNNF